jgi:hypothetical protein
MNDLNLKDIFSDNQTGLFVEDLLTGEHVCQAIASYCKNQTPVIIVAENHATGVTQEAIKEFNTFVSKEAIKFYRWSQFEPDSKVKHLPKIRESIAQQQADKVMKDMWGLFPGLG